MMVRKQPWLGDEINRDLIVRVCAADIPDLSCVFGVLFPFIAGNCTSHRFKGTSIGAIKHIAATLAVHEIEYRAAIKVVSTDVAEHPVQTSIFFDSCLGCGVIEEIAAGINIDTKLTYAWVERPSVEVVATLTADQIIVALTSEQGVDIGTETTAAITD